MNSERDPIIWMLFAGTVFFTFVLIGVAVLLKTDGQTFQVIASLLSGFAGALLTRIKPPSKPDTSPPSPPSPLQQPPASGIS